MGLGKRKGSANIILPLLKFDARHGTLHLEERVLTSNGWERRQTDITDDFRGVFDLAGLQRGWIRFPRGAAPEATLVPAGQDPGESPSEDHREGFRVLLQVNGTIYEFMSTSVSAWTALDTLHDAYLREAPKHPVEAPVVRLHNVVERHYASGASFEPSCDTAGWVPRPDEFGAVEQPQQKQPQQKQLADLDDEIPF